MTLKAAPVSASMSVALDRAVLALSDALEFTGVDEVGHGHRVALMTAMCARTLDWEPERIHRLVQAGLMHDCGVSSTREHRQLIDDIVWDGAHAHCERGFAYLGSVPSLAHLAPIVLEHHTPWSSLVRRGVDHGVAEMANLIFLCDRADAVRARGVGEGRPVIDVLARYEDNHFAPVLMAVFREEAAREAFWFAQEGPTLRERIAELALTDQPVQLSPVETRALAGMFGRIVDAMSPHTEHHSIGVAKVALRLGRSFGLPSATMDALEIAALLTTWASCAFPMSCWRSRGG